MSKWIFALVISAGLLTTDKATCNGCKKFGQFCTSRAQCGYRCDCYKPKSRTKGFCI